MLTDASDFSIGEVLIRMDTDMATKKVLILDWIMSLRGETLKLSAFANSGEQKETAFTKLILQIEKTKKYKSEVVNSRKIKRLPFM